MLIKLFKWLLLGTAGTIISVLLILDIGARVSRDYDYQHTQDTQALPAFSPGTSASLVRITANGQEFRARIAGFDSNAQKPAVILLHGFPVTSAMWNKLIPPLAEAGFRVVAFDQRGYSPGARFDTLENYSVEKISGDVIDVADALGLHKFHLIGHDWGAAIGWATVLSQPQRILSWTGLSIAHPAAFSEALQNDPDQKSRSGYFKLFATPWLPEALFSFNDFNLLLSAYDGMSKQQKQEYLKVFSEPGALTAVLNWYRAMVSSLRNAQGQAFDVDTPTVYLGQQRWRRGPFCS